MQNLCDYQNKTFSSNKVDDNYHTGVFGSGVRSAFWDLIMALIFKFVFTIFTFGIKVPCGLFVPSIAMGAIAGRLTGMSMESVFRSFQMQSGHSTYWSCQIGKDCVMPGLYAMVGAAAVLGGVTRMTVSLVVIMFELTGSLEFIVPTMVATMFSKWIGDAICKTGIYDAHIELNGYPFLDNKEEYPYSTIAIQLFDRCGPEDYMQNLCDYQNKTFSSNKVDDNYHTGVFGSGVRSAFWDLIMALIFKFVFTIFTFGIKVPCGLFVPSIAMGAIAGRLTGMTRKTQPYVVTDSIAYFTNQVPESTAGGPAPLRLRKIIDLAPMAVTDQTPMETVIDMFRKLGLRQVMRPSASATATSSNAPENHQERTELAVIVQDGMSVGDIEQLLRESNYNGFPVVVSRNSMYLVGFVTRRDLQLALHAARKTQPYVVTDSIAYFTNQVPESTAGGPAPLRLRKIIDLVLVTKNGKVLGIITKKDILQFMRNAQSGFTNPNFK
ncbi:chloride transporter, ClC family [Cooperia oncophora]